MADNNSDNANNNLQLLRVNHSVKMTEAFETMFLDESLCDVSICCSGQVVKAHRVILAACSAYFKQILSSINGQTQYPVIFVNGIEMSDLSAMLEFMYRGDVTIPQTQLSSLVKSAEILGVSGLCQLDPNAQNLSDTPEKTESRTSSPTDSTVTSRRGRKRKKFVQKPENEMGSDLEIPEKKTDENCEESEDMESSEGKPTEKLAKSKLRSWTQQIALKANHKEGEESQPMSESDSHSQPTIEESDKTEPIPVDESTGSQPQLKKNILKENWRHSRARRPPLKFSEYTLPKGIQDLKNMNDNKETDGEAGESSGSTVVVRPPTPRLTRGRSRIHSVDDQKVITTTTPTKDEPIEAGIASTSTDSQNSTFGGLTPNTRSRKQTHSPSEGKLKDKDKEKEKEKEMDISSQISDEKPTIKIEEDTSSQVRNKTAVKPQISTLPSSSLIKWRPKDPQLTTTKFTAKIRSPVNSSEGLNYQYESIQADGPPVYRCSNCLHCFRSKQNIIDHIRSVHNKSEDRYVCPLCHKQFKWKTSLNNHLNQLHPLSRPTPLRHFEKSRKTLP